MATKEGEEVCPVCREVVEIYAVPQCDHPICYKCSTRMRVLCAQMYCAICRTDVPKVVFIKVAKKFDQIDIRQALCNRKYRIYFENEKLQDSFQELLQYQCQICQQKVKPFKNFHMLQNHMRKEHEQFSCDLCLEHLKIFNHERKYYDRRHLALHKRVGDEDDKSHKGHPLCRFCDIRYLDNDELVRHLRKDHYFCHFCESEGISNEFFCNYSLLADHFADYHYVCDEGECAHAQFTNAFASDIDLKAHRATMHTKNMRRAQAKQARTLEIDFSLPPRESEKRRQQRDRDRDGDRDRGPENDNADHREREHRRGYGRARREDLEMTRDYVANLSEIQRQSGSVSVLDPSLLPGQQVPPAGGRGGHGDTARGSNFRGGQDDFPSLDGQTTSRRRSPDLAEEEASRMKDDAPGRDNMAKKFARANQFSVQDGDMEDQDFPSLGGFTARAPASGAGAAPASKGQGRGRAPSQQSGGHQKWAMAPVDDDFPALGGRRSAKPPVSASVSNARVANGRPAGGGALASANALPAAAVVRLQAERSKPTSAPTRPPQQQPPPPMDAGPRAPGPVGVTNLADFPSLSSIGSVFLPKTTAAHGKSTKAKAAPPRNEVASAGKPSGRPRPPPARGPEEDFPVLGRPTPSAAPPTASATPATSQQRVPSSSKTAGQKLTGSTESAPAAGRNSDGEEAEESWKTSTGSKKKKKKQAAAEEDFPALGVGGGGGAAEGPGEEVATRDAENNKEFEAEKRQQRLQQQELRLAMQQQRERDLKAAQERQVNDLEKFVSQKTKRTKNKQKGEKESTSTPGAAPADNKKSSEGGVSSDGGGSGSGSGNKSKRKAKKGQVASAAEEDFDLYAGCEEPSPVAGPKAASEKKKKEKEVALDTEREVEKYLEQLELEMEDMPDLSGLSMKVPLAVAKPVSFKPEDFPSLGIGSSNARSISVSSSGRGGGGGGGGGGNAPKAPPPGFSANFKPAPGLSALADMFNGPTKPPPGFADKVRPTVNGGGSLLSHAMATSSSSSSSSSSTSFSPSSSSSTLENQPNGSRQGSAGGTRNQPAAPCDTVQYSQPKDFEKRNQRLIKDTQKLFDGSDNHFNKFKVWSGEFRQDMLDATEYYDKCLGLMGDQFLQIFPELICLLPDVARQQELLSAHNQAHKRKGNSGVINISGKASKSSGWNIASTKFSSCPCCHQVLASRDYDEHVSGHNIDSDFPALGPVPASTSTTPAWGRWK